MIDYRYICRVCGLVLEDPPWGVDGKTPLFEFCLCCGVEFGYGDWTVGAAKNWRRKWLSKGAVWFDASEKPEEWDVESQLKNVPPEFR